MAELPHRERVPGGRLVWLFRAAPAPAQCALVSAGRQVPGRSVRWDSLRRLRPSAIGTATTGGRRSTGTTSSGSWTCAAPAASGTARAPTWSTSTGATPSADLHADLHVRGSLPAGSFGCVILTQVLQFLSPEAALANLWASFAPGLVLLLTVTSPTRVDPHDHRTGFWRFTPNGLAELLRRVGIGASVCGYGNVLSCVAALWGLAVEELSDEELDFADPRFPLVACAHAEKAG